MTCRCGHEMLQLRGRRGEQVYVDPSAIAAIETSPGRGAPGDKDFAPPLTRLVLPGSVVFVTESPEVVFVQRQYVLSKARADGEDDPLGWKFPGVVLKSDIGPVDGGAP